MKHSELLNKFTENTVGRLNYVKSLVKKNTNKQKRYSKKMVATSFADWF